MSNSLLPQDSITPAFPFITISWSLLKLISIESVMISSDLILCPSLLLLSSIFPSLRVFCNDLVFCIKWPKYWSFSCSISLLNEYSGLISFRIDGFELLALQGPHKHLLQQYSWKHQFFFHPPFCKVQHSHLHMTTRKTIALTTQTFVNKLMSLFFNMKSRFVRAFLLKSQHILTAASGRNHYLQWFWGPRI